MASFETATETHVLKLSDNSEMQVFVARPKTSGNYPGIILLQEAFGVNSHFKELSQRFAKEGYVVVTPELFHRTAPKGFIASYDDFPSVVPHYQAVNEATLQADLKTCFDWLNQDAQVRKNAIAAIGYCMGGRAAYVGNAHLPLKAACSYYGGGIADLTQLAEKQHSKLLLIWGGADQHIGVEKQRAVHDAMKKAKKPFIDLEFSDADHGFFCDEKKVYHPIASREAWALTLSFLKENLA